MPEHVTTTGTHDITGTTTFNSHGVLEGDGTTGRVLRAVYMYVYDSMTPGEIIVRTYSWFNADADVDGPHTIGKGDTEGIFSLSADGKTLTFATTGNCVGIFSASVMYDGISNAVTVYPNLSSGNLTLIVYLAGAATATPQDWTTLMDGGDGKVGILLGYVTSA